MTTKSRCGYGVGFMGFVTSWEAVARYRKYLDIILSREADAARDYVKTLADLRAVEPCPIGEMSDEMRQALDDGDKARPLVQLEIESFYLFANILLDSVARALDKYFRPRRPPMPSFICHKDLVKRFEEHRRLKKITIPLDFIENATALKDKVSEFRNEDITHDKRINRVTAMGITRDGKVTIIATSSVVPQEVIDNHPQSSTVHVGELIQLVDAQVAAAVEIVRNNRAKRVIDYTG